MHSKEQVIDLKDEIIFFLNNEPLFYQSKYLKEILFTSFSVVYKTFSCLCSLNGLLDENKLINYLSWGYVSCV